MNAAAIVYTSQTGFTARYAALLAERTGLPCRPLIRSFISISKAFAVIATIGISAFSLSKRLLMISILNRSSRCTPYGRTPLTEFRTCGFPASGSLRNESFTLSFVYIDIYPGSYQWIAVIQHI